DIDYVILTHLHTDHSAGTVKLENDKFVPRFPNAKIIISKEEWEDAINPNERTSAVYIPERFFALQNANQVELIELDKEILPGIKAVRTGGHTGGHFALEIESDNQRLYYYADIFPSSTHIKVPFVPATDLYPLDTMAIKRKKLPEIIENEVVMAFDHDINIPLGIVRQDGKKIFVESV
ncbi:MAG: MBL fold metallo-hydrolase, partial [candidate division Zixibacteria bacterium]|nr:MBL fold metallo-hydrolase [candidate division Zixibacteria bacterium]